MRTSTFILIFINSMYLNLQAQQIIASGSGAGSIGTLQFQYTLGEMVAIQTATTSTSQIITQGYHQPFRLFVNTIEVHPLAAQLNVYPNPTTDQLILKATVTEAQDWQVRITNQNGQHIMEQTWQLHSGTSQLQYSMHDKPVGVYYMHCKHMQTGANALYKVVKLER